MLPTIEHSVRCGLLMKARWDDEDDDDVMTRSQPQPPPGQPCHALLWLPAGVRRGDRVDFRWFDEGRSCGAEWRGGRCQTGGKAVIWCNELWLWLSVLTQLFPRQHLLHPQVTRWTITKHHLPNIPHQHYTWRAEALNLFGIPIFNFFNFKIMV